MKTTRLYYLGVSGLALVCAACGASKPSPELVTARNMYTQARNGEAAQLNPSGVHEAYKALQAAEVAHEDDAGSSKERHRAYVATRKSELAIAQASEKLAMKEQERADVTYKQALQQQSAQLGDQLAQQAQEADQQTSQYRDQLQQAQAEAEQAQEELRRLESIKEEAGRTTISLPGVLFKVGQAELSPAAEARLATVASALKAYPDRDIVIEGFTDAQGDEEKNLALSEQRANAVREYLQSQGISGDRLRSEGRGEANPIASNDTAEGRAYNRRVEIVVDTATASRPTEDQTRQNVAGTDDEAPVTPPKKKPAPAQPSQGQPPAQGQPAPQQPE